MNKEETNFIELGKGLLIVISYFLLGNILSAFFSSLIKKGIFPDTNMIKSILTLFIYIILATFYYYLYRKKINKEWKTFKKNPKKNLSTGFNYWLKGLFIMLVSNAIIIFLFKLGNSVNEQTNIELIKRSMSIQVPITVLIVPFIEEIVFRGSFYKMTKNKHIFAWSTGILFGFLHIVSSLDKLTGFLFLIPYSAMGIAFGYLYKKTDSIFPSMFMHMIHNGITIFFIIIAIKMGVY